MSSPNPYTLEKLINSLDQRGLLILNVLIGQRAIEILAEDTKVKPTKQSMIAPKAKGVLTPWDKSSISLNSQ